MATIDLLVNHGIPVGWTNLLPWYNLTNQQPKGFQIHIAVPGEELDSADSYTGPDDTPVVTTATIVPECRHIHKNDLPEDEQPGAENALILEGDWVYKLFARSGAFSGDVYAWVRAPADGVLDIDVPVQVHYNPKPGGDGSPGAAVWRLWVDNENTEWHTFGDGFLDRLWAWVRDIMRVTAGQVVTIRLQVESRSQAGIDFFTDLEAWRADFTPDEPEDPEPVDPDGWTIGREQYERTVVLMPPGCDEQWPMAAMSATWNEKRYTVGGSADDAGIGPEVRRVIAINDTLWHADGLGWWFDLHYPGIGYVALCADSPADLEDVLTDYIHGGIIPEPPPDPPPDPDPVEPQYTLRSKNLIGLHSGFMRAQTMSYVKDSGTCIQKNFSAGDAYLVAKEAPGIVAMWRRYVGNEQGRIWERPTIRLSAQWYLDLYTAEIETARTNMGLTIEQFLERKIAIESLNETIPTFNQPVLDDCVEFDVHFCDLAHERYGAAINTVLLCGAIGNPHESEVPMLLPAADIAYLHGDFIGYHEYWTDNQHENDPRFIDQHWPYHAGRWMEWDDYFRSQGVFPRYASGEGGIVYAWDGVSFDSGRGWKACGSFENYLQDIDVYNKRVLAWNAEHGNRNAGLTLFGYGNWGWDNFELGDGEVILLQNWATGTPTSYRTPGLASMMSVERLALIEAASKDTASNDYLRDATYISDDWRKQIESREPIKRGVWR